MSQNTRASPFAVYFRPSNSNGQCVERSQRYHVSSSLVQFHNNNDDISGWNIGRNCFWSVFKLIKNTGNVWRTAQHWLTRSINCHNAQLTQPRPQPHIYQNSWKSLYKCVCAVRYVHFNLLTAVDFEMISRRDVQDKLLKSLKDFKNSRAEFHLNY